MVGKIFIPRFYVYEEQNIESRCSDTILRIICFLIIFYLLLKSAYIIVIIIFLIIYKFELYKSEESYTFTEVKVDGLIFFILPLYNHDFINVMVFSMVICSYLPFAFGICKLIER